MAVAPIVLRAWGREIAAVFGARERTVMLACVALFMGAGLSGALLAWLFGMLPGDTTAIPGPVRYGLLRMVLASTVLSSALLMIVFCLLAPQRTTLAALIELLPVTRAGAVAGLNLPLVGLSFLLALTFSAPSFVMVAQLLGSAAMVVFGIVMFAVLVALVKVMTFSLFMITFEVGRRFVRLPSQYALTVAAVFSCGCVVALSAHDLWPTPELLTGQTTAWWHAWTPSGSFALTLATAANLANLPMTPIAAVAGWTGAVVALFLLAGQLLRTEHVSPSIRLLVGMPVPRTRLAAQAWFEALILLRTPQFSIMTVLIVAITVAVALWVPGQDDSALFDAVLGALVMAPMLVCMQSVGLTLRTHWLARHLLATSNSWALPKALGTLVASAPVSILVLLILGVSGLLGMDQVPTMGAGALAAWGAALLGGALVPYSEAQPLSAGLTGFTVMILFLGVAGGLEWFLDGISLINVPLASLLALGVFVLGYALVVRRVADDDTSRI